MPLDLGAVLNACPDPVLVVGESGAIVWGNRAAEDTFGWRLEDVAGSSAADFVHPDDLPTALVSLESVQQKDRGTLVDIRIRTSTGGYDHFEVRGQGAADVPGVGGIVLVLRDVTERAKWEVSQGETSMLQALVEHTPAITVVLAEDGTIRGSTRALTRVLGHDIEAVLGRSFQDLAAEHDRGRVAAELSNARATAAPAAFEADFDHSTVDRFVALNLTITNLLDDRAVNGLVVTATDITLLADAQARLEHMVTHDGLTGLPNRTLLDDRLTQALARARRGNSSVAVAFCDLDDFKGLNDTYGHLAGDRVLIEVARRLSASVRKSDTVARLHGDEFVVVAEGPASEVDALFSRVRSELSTPIAMPSGETVVVTASLGHVLDDGSSSAAEVLARADAAMYADKGRRRPPA